MSRKAVFPWKLEDFFSKTVRIFLLFILSFQISSAQTTADITILEPDKPVEREITGSEKHKFQILMQVGDYAGFIVLERKTELKVTVSDPQNKQILEVDAPFTEGEQQNLHFIALAAGNYLIVVTPSSQYALPGSYRINLKEIHAATEKDRRLAEVLQLNVETRKLRHDGKYDEALASAEKALAMLAKIDEAETVEGADIINETALIYDSKGEYQKAEQNYLRALEMYKKKFGEEHFFVATVLNNLGELYRTMSLYDKSETAYQRALAINEKFFNPEHLNVATVLTNLAYLYYTKGEYSKAEPLYKRGLSIREKQLGSDSLDVGITLNNLALLYRVQGDYPQAVEMLRRVLNIFEKNLPSEHPNIATVAANLAAVNTEMGDYEKAEELYERVLEIDKKTLSPESPAVSSVLNNMATLYDKKGEYEKAAPMFLRALAIREKAFGADHPLVAASLNNLALFYRDRGENEKAEPLFRRALEIYRKKLGEEHSSVAVALNNIGLVYFDKGEYDKAEPLFQQALTIFTNANGKDHPLTARPLANLAKLYAAKSDFVQALAYQKKYLAIREKNLELNLYTGSERQKIAYLETLSQDVDSAISFSSRSMPKSEDAATTALGLVLSRKGRAIDAMSGSTSSLRRRASVEDQKLFDRLSDTRTLIANLTLRGAANDKPEVYQEKLRTIGDEKEKLEDILSRRSAEFRALSEAVSIDNVRLAIPENAALVEFVSYIPDNPKKSASSASKEKKSNPRQYVAYVLRRQGAIQWQELGDAETIDAAINSFRQSLRDPQRKDVSRLSQAVDKKIIEPVRALLGDAEHLFVSPDGELNSIPFEALVDGKQHYLVENYLLTYLTSGRDLLRMKVKRDRQSTSLIIANPLFDSSPAEHSAAASKTRNPAGNKPKIESVTATHSLSDTYFAPIGGTAQEARSIKTLFPDSTLLSGAQATETALKQTNAPTVLHIATHGFFLEDSNAKSSSGDANTAKRNAKAYGEFENPLLRSGLALAGANQHGENGGDDDGILTALEASSLNLWGTKLVVLSACDTGVGEIKNGEGVYGLRRAFTLAGTDTLVMSLWSVSDYVTRELMTNYYKNLKAGMGRGAALRQVQLEMLRKKGREHPFYWAAFIESGEWANLDGKR